ncbi:glycosyltransferase family 2 protein [Curtobacterium sp. MCBD17_028]|nr:glycosyltransferase family 2 protein [Curtobacterium sp. MCBD17_028]
MWRDPVLDAPLLAAAIATHLALAAALTAFAALTLLWSLHTQASPERVARSRFDRTPRACTRSFSLLVPARHEEGVLADTLDLLAAQTHPRFEVIVIVGHDDRATARIAEAAAARHPDHVRVVVDRGRVKTKPRALNRGLAVAAGSVIGVFDAEDDVHERLLERVDARFAETGADVVQGGVQLMNHARSWWRVRNVVEYALWFGSRLHAHAAAGVVPLAGNTVFVRRRVLERIGGWQDDCLAEDCELGIRLSAAGARIDVVTDPTYSTREETPPDLRGLLRQRVRWNQGFLQVLRGGAWKGLPSWRRRTLARVVLGMPFAQVLIGMSVPVAVVETLAVRLPVPVTLVTLAPVAPSALMLVVECLALDQFGRAFGRRVRPADHVRLVLGAIPFQVVLSVAAVVAVWREVRGDHSWQKTVHTGLHRRQRRGAPTPGRAPA